jgi:hypothetical protein
MPRFLVLARDDPGAFAGYSPSEAQAIIQRYIAWSQDLAARGHLESSEKLRDGVGRVIGAGASATDGPFVEVKEVVGGFWIVSAADLDEAQSLMSDSPHLDFGSLEIREIEPLDED